jgi:hypothetical protein
MVREYVVDAGRGCVRVRLSGVLTTAALLTTFLDVQRDPRVTSEFRALIDLRGITAISDIRHEDVRTIASWHLDGVARRAFVAQHPAVVGLCETFAILRDLVDGAEPVAVFRSVADADAWLDLPVGERQPGEVAER